MNEAIEEKKPGRKARPIEEEIALQQARLKKLQEKQRAQQRREGEKNQKAVMALIRAEGLDGVPTAQWKDVMPQLKKLLKV